MDKDGGELPVVLLWEKLGLHFVVIRRGEGGSRSFRRF